MRRSLPQAFTSIATPRPPETTSGSISQLSTYELDPWQYRFAVGLRFRWMPE